MVNNFVGLFIIFLPRIVLFRVATLHIACVAGVLRGGKRERLERKAREDPGTFSLQCSFSLSSLSFSGLPHRLLCIMLLLAQNMFLGVLSIVTMTTRCRNVWWLLVWWTNEQKHSITAVRFLVLTLSVNFLGLEIWHETFYGLISGPGSFFGFCFEALGILGVLIFAPIQLSLSL